MSDYVHVNIALDNGCLNAKGKHPVLNKLDDLEEQGLITLSTSSTSTREQIETQKSGEWLTRYLNRIQTLKLIMEPAIVDIAKVGLARVAPDETGIVIKKISKICFPGLDFSQLTSNQKNDILHLVTAIDTGADYFLTHNKNDMILNGKQKKLEKYGIKIREPNESLLKELNSLVNGNYLE